MTRPSIFREIYYFYNKSQAVVQDISQVELLTGRTARVIIFLWNQINFSIYDSLFIIARRLCHLWPAFFVQKTVWKRRLMKKYFNKKILALMLAIITCAGVFTACVKAPGDESSSQPTDIQDEKDPSAELNENHINLGNGLVITYIGGYTGIYMEDGSDEVVSGILMIIVSNTTNTTLQYGKISLKAGETDAIFELTTLPAGKSAVLLEKSRLEYDKTILYTDAKAENTAFFQQEPSLMEDRVKLQLLDGVINVTNISDKDIDGEIVIYYKNAASDLYYGGITYRSRVAGGLKAGQTQQIAGAHASKTGSAAMFVQII